MKHNSQSKPRKVRKGPYKPSELRRIEAWEPRETPLADLARALDRDYSALYRFIYYKKAPKSPPRAAPSEQDIIEKFEDLYRESTGRRVTAMAVARELGLKNAVRVRQVLGDRVWWRKTAATRHRAV